MILEVEITNWRAYDRGKYTFKPGLNFMMGPNGKGKTSILEAIAYALTGEASVVDARDYLLRDPEKAATVKLTFQVDGNTYRIERTQQPGKAGEASLYDLRTNHKLASYQKNVTEKVEELLGVSADFLRRIIYMAEGDVFRFLKDPPGKAVNQQIQQVLGLTQLDAFQEAVKLAQKRLRDQSKALKSLQDRIAGLNLAPGQNLDEILANYNAARAQLLEQQLKLQAEIGRLEEQDQSLQTLGRQIEAAADRLKPNLHYSEASLNLPLGRYYQDFQQMVQQGIEQLAVLEKTLFRLQGQADSSRRVLDLLSTASEGMLACPVCRKPMTPLERSQAIREAQGDLDRIQVDIAQAESEIQQVSSANGQAQQYLEDLRGLWLRVAQSTNFSARPELSLNQILSEVQPREKPARQVALENQLGELHSEMNDIDNQRANFLTLQNQLQEHGFSNPEDVRDALVFIEMRALTLDAAAQAAGETLQELRDGGLKTVYDQIAAIWNHFIQRGEWTMRLDQEGNPLLTGETRREFDFSQFSGGEKTALLTIIHTLIAHYFSKSKFLMIDEPLEHLDPVNRRSLMRFFLAACHNRFFDQALITTYEEALVRKYISEEDINIIYL